MEAMLQLPIFIDERWGLVSEITRLLEQVGEGDLGAEEQLFRMVHDELKYIASARLSGERPGHTLQTTALVNEAYLRLFGTTPASQSSTTTAKADDPTTVGSSQKNMRWDSRGHFFAAAAEAMRRILIDNARRKKRKKRGGNNRQVPLGDVEFQNEAEVDLEILDGALAKLESQNKMHATVVKLRYFAGMTIGQTADALGTSPATVKRSWAYSKAWLRREIGD